MTYKNLLISFGFITFTIKDCFGAIDWTSIRCSSDPNQKIPEGVVSDFQRFPWLGVVQHNFYIGGKPQYAITNALLVHPGYALAPAEDISRIEIARLENNTRFIMWRSETQKYVLEVTDYFIHPEYDEDITFATIALVQLNTLGLTGVGSSKGPSLPICMPVHRGGTLSNLYAVTTTDDGGTLHKEIYKMNYVPNDVCEDFYNKTQLNQRKMAPINPICAKVSSKSESCVWDAGVALISKMTWSQWSLIGFGTRGPGCGAPCRFIAIHRYLPWIEDMISKMHTQRTDDEKVILFRRVSPIKLVLYDVTKTRVPTQMGQCGRKEKGHVLFKDNSEVLANKNLVQGFYFVSVSQLAAVSCAVVTLEVSARSRAAVWIEHHCHRDYTGHRVGAWTRDMRHAECFVYFKSVAFIEFRFYFSFRAMLETTLYGHEEAEKIIPNPFPSTDATYNWMPTYNRMEKYNFHPYHLWMWHV